MSTVTKTDRELAATFFRNTPSSSQIRNTEHYLTFYFLALLHMDFWLTESIVIINLYWISCGIRGITDIRHLINSGLFSCGQVLRHVVCQVIIMDILVLCSLWCHHCSSSINTNNIISFWDYNLTPFIYLFFSFYYNTRNAAWTLTSMCCHPTNTDDWMSLTLFIVLWHRHFSRIILPATVILPPVSKNKIWYT